MYVYIYTLSVQIQTLIDSKFFFLKGYVSRETKKHLKNGWLPDEVEHFDQLAVRDPGAKGSG